MADFDPTHFRALITAQLASLDADDALGKGAQATVELDQTAVGRLSRQDALLSQSMANATAARRDVLRRGLCAALARLDADEYGWCDGCGDAIPTKRLELDLTATRCVACATRR